MNLSIVHADLGDPRHGAAVLEVVDSYSRDPMGGGAPLSAEVRGRLVSDLRAHPTTRIELAFDGDRPVGVAVCFLGYSTFQARPLLNVHDLAVIPEYRGRGIGRALLAAIEATARTEGCCELTLEVLEDNPRARTLYASVGFTDPVQGTHRPMRFLVKLL